MFDESLIAQVGLRIFGTQPPKPAEIAKARALMAAAPEGGDPLAVARYFEALPDRNEDGESFNAEWKVRSNPLIVMFFEATSYRPSDLTDQTKWCAAFVNWCLRRAGRDDTNSASSGSFRCFGEKAATPGQGDLAVFKNTGQDEPCRGSGHVAFWVGETDTYVRTLGGNQGDKVKESNYRKSGNPAFLTVRKSP